MIVAYATKFFTAMENWGLVTYREETLLYNKTIHSNNRKLSVVTTIAHGENFCNCESIK